MIIPAVNFLYLNLSYHDIKKERTLGDVLVDIVYLTGSRIPRKQAV